MEIVYDPDAYNVYGENLENDREQSRKMIAGTVLVSIMCALIVLAVILSFLY